MGDLPLHDRGLPAPWPSSAATGGRHLGRPGLRATHATGRPTLSYGIWASPPKVEGIRPSWCTEAASPEMAEALGPPTFRAHPATGGTWVGDIASTVVRPHYAIKHLRQSGCGAQAA